MIGSFVPKVAVDENCNASARKNNVCVHPVRDRRVHAIPQPGGVQGPAQQHFGLGVPGLPIR